MTWGTRFTRTIARSPIPQCCGIGVVALLVVYAALSAPPLYAGTWSGSNPDDGLSLSASWNEISTVGGTTNVSLVFNVPDGFYVYPKIVDTADDSLAYPLCEDGSNLQLAYRETLLWTAASAGTYRVYYSLNTVNRLPDCEDVTTQLGGDLVIAAYTPPTSTPTPDASGQQATPTPTHTPTPTYRYVGTEDANEVQISAAWDDIVVAGGSTTITLYVTWPDDPNIYLRLENVSTGGAILPYCSSTSGQGTSGQSQTGDWNGSATAGTYRIYYALRTDFPTSAPACTTTYSPDIVIADGLTPAQPTGLTATARSAQVTLNWDDPGNANITSYEYIQKRGTDSFSAWDTIPGSSATTTSHTFTGLDNGVRYTYSIRAINNGRTSANSLVADATTPATPTPTPAPTPSTSPLDISHSSLGSGTEQVTWSPIAYRGALTTVTFTIKSNADTGRSGVAVWGGVPLMQRGCAFENGDSTVTFTLQLSAGTYTIRTVHQGANDLNCQSASLNPNETSVSGNNNRQAHTLRLAEGSGGPPAPVLPAISALTFTQGELVDPDSNSDAVLPAASSGSSPYTYALSALPKGLTEIRDISTNEISLYGVPVAVGSTTMQYSATGNRGVGGTTTRTFTIVIEAYTEPSPAPTHTPTPEISIANTIRPNTRFHHRQGPLDTASLKYLIPRGGWSELAENGFVSSTPPHNDVYITERYFIACDGAFIWRQRERNVFIYSYGNIAPTPTPPPDPTPTATPFPTPMPVSVSAHYLGAGSYYSVLLENMSASGQQSVRFDVALVEAGEGVTAIATLQGLSLLLDTTNQDSYRIYWENNPENYREVAIPASYEVILSRTGIDPVYASITSAEGSIPDIISVYDGGALTDWELTNSAYTEQGLPPLWRMTTIAVNSGSTVNYYAYAFPARITSTTCTVTEVEQSFTLTTDRNGPARFPLTLRFRPGDTVRYASCTTTVESVDTPLPDCTETLIPAGEVEGFLGAGEWAGFLRPLGEAADATGLPSDLIAIIFWLASTISIVGLTFYTTRIPMLAMIMAVFLTVAFAWATPLPMVVAWLVIAGVAVIALNFRRLLA